MLTMDWSCDEPLGRKVTSGSANAFVPPHGAKEGKGLSID